MSGGDVKWDEPNLGEVDLIIADFTQGDVRLSREATAVFSRGRQLNAIYFGAVQGEAAMVTRRVSEEVAALLLTNTWSSLTRRVTKPASRSKVNGIGLTPTAKRCRGCRR